MRQSILLFSFAYLLGGCSGQDLPTSLTFLEVADLELASLGTVVPQTPVCTTDADCTSTVDASACERAVCSAEGVCSLANKEDGTSCDDGNACTEEDTCQAGSCQAGEGVCLCESDPDCVGEKFDLCQGKWACVDTKCVVQPDTAIVCPDSDEACVVNACDSPTGACALRPAEDGDACDDGNACTTASACSAGKCAAQPGTELVCDDENTCTSDQCDVGTGCVFDPIQGDCDDGNACTIGDSCQAGSCLSVDELNCNVEGQCLNGTCDSATGCVVTHVANGAECDDGNACTEGDTCVDGTCGPGQSVCECEQSLDCIDDGDLCNGVSICVNNVCVIDPATIVDCGEGSPCAAQVCEEATGNCAVELFPNGTGCDSGEICTQDGECADGWCQTKPTVCDDDNPCTADACNPQTGACKFDNLVGPCTDDDPCTLLDVCQNGACVAGKPDSCDDANMCTEDTCVLAVGCDHKEIEPCDDGLSCTNDTCDPGLGCVSSPVVCPGGGACVAASCTEVDGGCITTPLDGEGCDDGDSCTSNDSCVGDICQGVYSCDDGNPCTVDSCLAAGCLNTPDVLGAPCEDGDECTSGDQCYNGVCQGLMQSCADEDPCTMDSCSEGLCVHENVDECPVNTCNPQNTGHSCNDNDKETVADMCILGVCAGFKLIRHQGTAQTGDKKYYKTDLGVGHWFLAMETSQGQATSYVLGEYDDISQPLNVFEESKSQAKINDIHDGYAVRGDGQLLEFLGAVWTDETGLPTALKESGLGDARAVWVYRGGPSPRVFIAGEEDESPYMRTCDALFMTCESFELTYWDDYNWEDTRARALAGAEACTVEDGCNPVVLMVGDGTNNQDLHRNNVHLYYEPYWGDSWVPWYNDNLPGKYDTRDAARIGPGHWITVGGAGYMRTTTNDGAWSYTVSNLKPGQTERDFNAVWVVANTIMMLATVQLDGEAEIELWTTSVSGNIFAGWQWTVHKLGDVEGSGAGAFDIAALPDGQVRIVGTGKGEDEVFDGLIWVRTPK